MFENLWNLACMASGSTVVADYETDDRLAFTADGRNFAICAELAGDRKLTGYMVRISISEFDKPGEVAHFLSNGLSTNDLDAFLSCHDVVYRTREKLWQLINQQVDWEVIAEDLLGYRFD